MNFGRIFLEICKPLLELIIAACLLFFSWQTVAIYSSLRDIALSQNKILEAQTKILESQIQPVLTMAIIPDERDEQKNIITDHLVMNNIGAPINNIQIFVYTRIKIYFIDKFKPSPVISDGSTVIVPDYYPYQISMNNSAGGEIFNTKPSKSISKARTLFTKYARYDGNEEHTATFEIVHYITMSYYDRQEIYHERFWTLTSDGSKEITIEDVKKAATTTLNYKNRETPMFQINTDSEDQFARLVVALAKRD